MQVIREINELNNKFLALYGNIYEDREHLPPKQRELMQDRLLAEYKEELEILLMRATIDRAREKYRLQLELSAYTPRTWRGLWVFKRKYNRAAGKIIDEGQGGGGGVFFSPPGTTQRLSLFREKIFKKTPGG